MDFQTFRGSDVQEALHAVRRALGADAWIESTRHVTNGQGGAFGKSFVEVIAAPAMVAPRAGQDVDLGAAFRRRPRHNVVGENRVRRPTRGGQQGRLDADAVERELNYLRSMLDELTVGRPPRERAQAMLLAAGFEGALLKQLTQGATRAARGGREVLRSWLRRQVEERLTLQPHLIERPSRQIITCVGPTGAGKTTTLAKLAARAFIELERSVSVVSLDTFRVGAVEQWKRYAQLIGMPFDAATDPDEFRSIIESTSADVILVDTAGRSAASGESGDLLARCWSRVPEWHKEVLLVLPAWIRARDSERIAAAYGEPRLSGLVLTKLDETDPIGGALQPALSSSLPLTYLCDGARVPEDIHDAAPDAVLDALFPEPA